MKFNYVNVVDNNLMTVYDRNLKKLMGIFYSLFVNQTPANRLHSFFIDKCVSQKVTIRDSCVPEYIVYDEDTEAYSAGWVPFNQSAENLQSSFWIYQDSSQTKSMSSLGKTITLYGGGGYVVNLGMSLYLFFVFYLVSSEKFCSTRLLY